MEPGPKAGLCRSGDFSKTKPLSVQMGFPENLVKKYELEKDKYGDPNREGRILMAEFKDFFVVNVYTPNAKPDLTRLNLRHKKMGPCFFGIHKIFKKNKKP